MLCVSVAGYPLLNCSTAMQADGSTAWSCSQARFYSYTPATRASTKWTIRLTATTPASPSPFPLWWLSTRPGPLTFTVPANTPYVKLNTNTTGFFRVLYDASSYAALSFALNRPGFGGIYHDDRLGLVNDAFVLSSLSAQSWPATLNLSLFLQHDTSFPVWQVAYPSLFTVYTYIKYHNSTARVLYEQYMQQAMSGVAARLDLSRTATPSAADAILESLLGLAMVRFNVSGRVDALKLMFDQLYAERIRVSDINPNLIDMVLEAGIVDGSRPAAWQWVYEHFYLQRLPYLTNMTMDDPLASLSFANIVRALTASQSQVELQVLLDNLFDPTLIAQQHIPTFLQGIAYNHLGLPLVNRWLMTGDHFTSLIGNVTQQQARTTMIQTVLGYNTQVETITELALFFQGVDMPQQVRNATDAGLRTAAANVAWLSANYMPLQQYLESGVWRRPDGPPAAGPTPWLDRRLPDTAQPMSYTVVQQIDLDSSPPTFSGSVDIAVQVLRPTMHLVLHAHPSLTVSAVSMLSAGGAAIPIASVWRYTPNQYVVLNFSSLVQAQTSAQLHLEFSATLSPQPLSGLYLAYYTNSTGQRVNMAATQFESADARRAFPCFDEPAFKATFTISVHSSPRYPTVLSNMPASPPVPSPVRAGWQLTQFQPTVRMSSYLIALVVCDFAYTEVVQQCGTASIPSRVYAPAHRINETRIPARIAADIISYYCSYFDMPYPLPKEDHIYVPQFSAGAMENWGLITYTHTTHTLRTHTHTHTHTPHHHNSHRTPPHHLTFPMTLCALCCCQLRRHCSAVQRAHGHGGAAAARGRGDCARAGASVVRQSGDGRLVVSAVAERGLRHVRGVHRRRRVQPGAAHAGPVHQRRTATGADVRLRAQHTPHHQRQRTPHTHTHARTHTLSTHTEHTHTQHTHTESTQQTTHQHSSSPYLSPCALCCCTDHHRLVRQRGLRQGRQRAAHDAGHAGRGRVHRRSASVPEGLRVRQRVQLGPVRGDDGSRAPGGHRHRRRHGDGRVDQQRSAPASDSTAPPAHSATRPAGPLQLARPCLSR